MWQLSHRDGRAVQGQGAFGRSQMGRKAVHHLCHQYHPGQGDRDRRLVRCRDYPGVPRRPAAEWRPDRRPADADRSVPALLGPGRQGDRRLSQDGEPGKAQNGRGEIPHTVAAGLWSEAWQRSRCFKIRQGRLWRVSRKNRALHRMPYADGSRTPVLFAHRARRAGFPRSLERIHRRQHHARQGDRSRQVE